MKNATNKMTPYIGQVTNEQYVIIMESCSEVWTVLSVLGIVSNIINVHTFIAIGLNDGVTVSLLALSIFDLSYLLSSLSIGVSTSLYVIEMKTWTRFPIEPFAVSMFCANVMILINVTNVLTTTFLSVARCMCVAKPLQFKNTFTRAKTVAFIVSFTMFAIVAYSPVLANMGIVTKTDNLLNISRPVLWMSPNREYIKNIVWLLIDMILPVSTQVVLLVCVVIMARCLSSASTFRKSVMVSVTIGDKQLIRDSNQKDPTNKLTGKDLRVVQQVILISVVYIICNTPKIMISVVGAVETEFAVGTRYHNLYLSVNSLTKHFDIFNSSINTIIYYKYNTKFRKTLCCSNQVKMLRDVKTKLS